MKKLILLTALMLAGCGVKPPIEGRNDPYRPPQITYTGESLRDDTAIGDMKATRDSADILFVTVPVRATTNTSFYVDYRATFFDANGRPMSETGWAHKMLNANSFEYITANSLSPGAKDFQIQLRRAE
ncbi:hypothetical protein BH10PLA1_BH10PLA1_00380 [soil metagenome]